MYQVPDNLEYASYNFLNINGIKYLKEKKFLNAILNKTRDLFLISLYTGGLDIREILALKKKNLSQEYIIINELYGEPILYPITKKTYELFDKHSGNGHYALNLLKIIPKGMDINNAELNNLVRFLNTKLKIISSFIGLSRSLRFQDAPIIWTKMAKDFKIRTRAIHLVSEFNNNPYKRNVTDKKLELLSNTFNRVYTYIEEGQPELSFEHPVKQEDGSILLWQGEF